MPSRLHVSSIDVRVDGAALSAELLASMLEVRVKDNLNLPGTALIRISDPRLQTIDRHPLQLGKGIVIKAGALDDSAPKTIFEGEVVAIEPEFNEDGVVIAVRALEYSHRLHRNRQSRTFQESASGDMFRTVITTLGLQVGSVENGLRLKWFSQAGETDWEFLQRLARDNDFEVVARGKTVDFRKAGEGAGTPVTLAYGSSLLAFRPRLSEVQQPTRVNVRGWDPGSAQSIDGQANGVEHAVIGKSLSEVSRNGGVVTLADRTVVDTDHARKLAESHANRLADSYVEAEGTALGEPDIKAGSKVTIEGVGRTFGGTYVVTSALHSFRGGAGYKTHFTISGRSPRTLLDLMRPPEKRPWAAGLVVGIVTNNNDPDATGRVKVKFPALDDQHESTWARVVTLSAGSGNRGIMMLPQVGDEVVVGFENGDPLRPYVLGAVFNGQGKPGPDLLQNKDGSLAVKSDKKIWMKSVEDIEITSAKNMVVTIDKDVTEKEGGNYTNEATGNTKVKANQINIEAGGSLTIKGVSVTVEASASLSLKGATVSLQGTGPVQIKGTPIQIG